MTIARKRYIGSRAITLLPGTLVATCWKKRVLVGVDFIHRSRIRCLAWIASAVMLAMPSCAVLAESVYVANSGNSTLSKFNASGQFISTLWNPGPGNDPYFSSPAAVAISAVPEPSTYVMALAGLACGGFSMWRRRKRA